MNISKEEAIDIWKRYFDNEDESQQDFSGRVMHFNSYKDNTSKYGWKIDCLDETNKCTFIPVNILTSNERSGDCTFWANKKLFQLKFNKSNQEKPFEIICVIDDED